jgi:tetratricopeptide (TPR) repeat protein
MLRILIIMAVALIALPAWAYTPEEWDRCEGVGTGAEVPAEARIAYCTQLIQSGQLTTADLSAAYNNRGNAYRTQGLTDQAIADHTQAIALNPNDASHYYNRGNEYIDKKLPDQAIADYTQAIALKPDYASAYGNRGIAYSDKNLEDQALADYNKAIALDPSHGTFYHNRSWSYFILGQYDKALLDINTAIDLGPTANGYSLRGDIYAKLGKRDQAITDYRASLKISPTYQPSLDGLQRLGIAASQNLGASRAGELHFSYEYRAGAFLRRATGTVENVRGLRNALAALQSPSGAHGGYGLIGDDDLLGKEPGYGLRQLGLVARQYVTFDTLRVEQPSGWEQMGVQSGIFTSVDQLSDATLGWVFFDLRPKFEADMGSRLP